MFKGLKSKLEDEAKKLQATVSQYSENIAQQVRSGVNDVDPGGQARRLFNSGATRNSLLHSSNLFSDESGTNFDTEQLNEQNPNTSAMMQEIPEQDLLNETRQRHNSSGSFGSESSLSNLFSSIPGMLSSNYRLNTITSDVESESVATSSQFQSASKEQISTVLHKLQGRAASYKDKYRSLVKMYNELVRENEKYRETRESEAGEGKVKELQELVENYQSSMKEKKERIRQLTEENERLKKNIETSHDEQEISDLAVRRVTAEWKGRVDCLEEEWSKRLSDSEEAGTLAIAKVKAEMHRALEEKDAELQVARARCKSLELSATEAHRQIDELKATVDALENEKADMIEKLSEAKQQGVKAVRCEEEEKRQELKREMERKRAEEREEDERVFKEMIMKNDKQWALKFKEQEEQMQLAIEEREMQKVAAVMEHDRKNENLGVQVEQLTAEKLHLKSVLDDMKERHRQQMEELCISIEASKERHQQEISEIKNKEEEILTTLRKDFEAAVKSKKQLQDELERLKSRKQKAMEGAEDRNELISELAMERQTVDDLKKQHEDEIEIMRSEMLVLKKNYEEILKKNGAKEVMQRNAEMGELKQELVEFRQRLSNKEKEMEELHQSLEQKTAIIVSLESEKEILSAELVSTRELSKIHQHLQQQLKTVQMERDETEKRYSEMEERVDKAAQELEVDRRVLQQEKQQLEREKLNKHQWVKTEINKSEAEETKYKVQQYEAHKAKSNLNEKIPFLTDENGQLKSEAENQQAQIKRLKEEKKALVRELENLKKKDLVLLEDAELKESSVSNENELAGLKTDSLKDKGEVAEELRSKIENEKSSLVIKIEALERNLQAMVEEKNNMIKEMEDICGSRDTLEIKMKEMETNVRETLCKNDSEVERLKKELRDQIDEASSLRSAVIIAENEIKEISSKLDEMITKNEELETMNEKLRIEFLQKENIVSEFQKKIKEQEVKEDAHLESLEKSLEEEQKRRVILEDELAETKKNLDEMNIELQERKNNEEFLETELEKKRQEKEEEQKIRDQYAVALKNAKENLEEAQKQLADLDLVRIEKDRFVAELSLTKEDYERVIQQLKQENEQRAEEIKRKAEQKLLKMKKQCETDGKAAKAELLLQIDEMRSQIAEKDLQIEEQKLNISSLEQKLFDEGQNEKIINDLRANIQTISNERDMKLNKCIEMEAELNCMRKDVEKTKEQIEVQSQQITSLQDELENVNAQNTRLRENTQVAEQLEQERKVLLHEKENVGKEMERLQLEIVTLRKSASEESAKTSDKTKVESERHRLLRDLQKEIKQLYHDLNERTQQLDEAQSKLQELSAKKAENESGDICAENVQITDGQVEHLRTSSDLIERTDYEELCALRKQVAEYQKELENTKEAHKKELILLCGKASSSEQFNVIGLESITNGSILRKKENLSDSGVVFAEPTEAEYLRNVLYRYMNERETLGRESVTLARVIATVARFTHEQVNEVVAKEEQRNHGWVGGTVQGLISSAANLSSR
uniref:GRIP domain-containing protein n=1 Tax=Elaeophora elaphi TaxID=1147741 RepID=A0A0R3S3E8_9BILA